MAGRRGDATAAAMRPALRPAPRPALQPRARPKALVAHDVVGSVDYPQETPMTASPESLAAGRAYQQTLLAALGDDDPAVAQAATPAILRTLVDEAGDDLRTRPEPAEWSAVEVIGHMVDAELASSVRYRWILAQDEPDLLPYDQDLWAARFHSSAEPLDALLPLFDALRAAKSAAVACGLRRRPGAGGSAPGAGTRELRPDLPAAGRSRPGPRRPGEARDSAGLARTLQPGS